MGVGVTNKLQLVCDCTSTGPAHEDEDLRARFERVPTKRFPKRLHTSEISRNGIIFLIFIFLKTGAAEFVCGSRPCRILLRRVLFVCLFVILAAQTGVTHRGLNSQSPDDRRVRAPLHVSVTCDRPRGVPVACFSIGLPGFLTDLEKSVIHSGHESFERLVRHTCLPPSVAGSLRKRYLLFNGYS